MRHARKLPVREVEAGIRLRRLIIRQDISKRAEAREGLIYTGAGVLDMTRRPVQRQPAVEKIVGYIEEVRT